MYTDAVNEVTPAVRQHPGVWPASEVLTVETVPADPLDVVLGYHVGTCPLGPRVCADCRLHRDREAKSALVTARSERELIADWITAHADVCVYCGDFATHIDHLVPRPWTGNAVRRFVPTVPACQDCNVRISAAHVFTIAGRAEVAANSLRRKFKRELTIPDRTHAELHTFTGKMRVNITAAQNRRQLLRRRLIVLDAGGAPVVAVALLIAA